jgi:peptide/nickel transport system substrate-binding protein
MAHEVFICYANQDEEIANDVCSALESNGISCWMAPRDVTVGEEWDKAIMDAIPACRVVVTIFSARSNDSPYCISEIRTAFDLKKEILPILTDNTLPHGRIALYLGSKQWLHAQTPLLESHLKKLVDEVKKHLSQLDAREEAAAREKAQQEEEAARKEKERLEAQAKARREVEARAQREAEAKARQEVEARAQREAEAVEKEKERLEAEARAKKEAEETRKAKEAALKVQKEAETKKPPVEKGPPRVKKVWIFSGAGIVTVAIVGVLIFILFGPKGAVPGPTDTTTPTPTETTTTTPPPTTPPTTPSPTTPTLTESTATTPTPPTTTVVPPIVPFDTLRIATTDFGNESVDPNDGDAVWGYALYDPLITYDATGNPNGVVAASWEISPDGNTWTFHIRQGIKFHNGDPLTAEDVKFSVDRFSTGNLTNVWGNFLYNNKVSSSVIDDYTFRYVTEHPEPTLVAAFSNVFILPRDYFEAMGQDYFRAHPVGSGPWKFVNHTSGTSFTMEANTGYWGEVPAFKYIIDYQVPEEATQMAMLRSGEVDITPNLSMDNIIKLQKEGFLTAEVGLPILANISFQGTWFASGVPTSDIHVRQAMSYAIDRQAICDDLYGGNAVPGGMFYMHPGCYGWTDELEADAYNPDMARYLLAQAGYPTGVSGIHIYANETTPLDFLYALRDQWNEIGIEVTIEQLDFGTYWNYFFSSNRLTGTEPNVGWISLWVSASTPNSIYHAANMYCSWGAHNCGNDPAADSLYNKAFEELDSTLALQYWKDFQKYAREMYVNIGICQIKSIKVYNPHTLKFTSNTLLNFYDALAGIKHAD